MDYKEREKLYDERLDQAATPEETAVYLNLLKTLKEVEKFEADSKKVNAEIDNIQYIKQTDWIRFVGLMAPMVTSVILIITLMIQTSQTKESRLAQVQEKEDDKWDMLTTKLSAPDAPVNETIPTLIKGFYKSDRYRNTAIELSNNYLSIVKSEDTFNGLFKEYIKTIDRENYSYLVRLSRKLISQFSAAQSQILADSTSLKRFAIDTAVNNTGVNAFYLQKLKDDETMLSRATSELTTASKALASIIKRFTKNTSVSANNAAPLDLSNAYIYMANLDSVNFNGVILSGVEFDRVSFAHANLVNVKAFETSSWTTTAWWLADSISPSLLNYLTRFSYYSDLDQPKNSKTLYDHWMQQSRKVIKL